MRNLAERARRREGDAQAEGCGGSRETDVSGGRGSGQVPSGGDIWAEICSHLGVQGKNIPGLQKPLPCHSPGEETFSVKTF